MECHARWADGAREGVRLRTVGARYGATKSDGGALAGSAALEYLAMTSQGLRTFNSSWYLGVKLDVKEARLFLHSEALGDRLGSCLVRSTLYTCLNVRVSPASDASTCYQSVC